MIETLLYTVLIIAICMALLSVRLIFGKKKFVNSHVSGSKAMRKRGIHCVQSQDAEARTENRFRVEEVKRT